MKKILFCLLFGLISQGIMAQSYITSAGIRVGDGIGISVKQRVLKKVTVEGIAGVNSQYSNLTGLIEFHQPFLTRYFNLYGGVGGHAYFPVSQDLTTGGVGMDLVAGLELNISKINLSLDFMPAFNFTGSNSFFVPNKAISLRYIIINDKDFRKRQKEKEKAKRKAKRQDFFKDLKE